MAQATFPDGISTDIPKEKTLAEQAIDSLFGSMNEYLDAFDKLQAHAAAGRRIDCEH